MFTVAALKEKLRGMNLSTAGLKNELILRLTKADPSDQWIIDIEVCAAAAAEEVRNVAIDMIAELKKQMSGRQSGSLYRIEADLAIRE